MGCGIDKYFVSTQLDKLGQALSIFLSCECVLPKNAEDVKYAPDPTSDEQDLFAAVTKPGELQNWEVADSYTIRRGKYDIEKNNRVNNKFI